MTNQNSLTQITKLCQQAKFLISANQFNQCPADLGKEVAFAGRSNAGKSSALNCLTSANLARTSKTPGRTQLINFFSLTEDLRLVDLPGYGYAKVSLSLKKHWQEHLDAYLQQRQSLVGIILLMDIRHPLSDFDCLLLDFAKSCKLGAHILLTKADKLKFGAGRQQIFKVQQNVSRNFGQNFSIQLFSAVKRQGLEDTYQILDNWLLSA